MWRVVIEKGAFNNTDGVTTDARESLKKQFKITDSIVTDAKESLKIKKKHSTFFVYNA